MAAITLSHPTTRRPLSQTTRAAIWIGLLAAGQVADVVTTYVAMSRGAMEGNRLAATLLDLGGIQLLAVVKLVLVVSMAAAVWMVVRYRERESHGRSALAAELVWRGVQLCVIVLAVTALHNLSVIQDIGPL